MAGNTLCDLADISSAENCGESMAGIATTIYVAFKGDLKGDPPAYKTTAESDMGDFAMIEDTPGFQFAEGKRFYKWEIDTDSGQLTSTSVKQQKGFTNQLVFKIQQMTPTISALLRVLNNRKDAFIAIPTDDGKYTMIYHPTRNIQIDSGGISYDSGTTPDSDSGTTVTVSVPALAPVVYYEGEVSTTPAVSG